MPKVEYKPKSFPLNQLTTYDYFLWYKNNLTF